MKEILQNLIKLAEEWVEFSKTANGYQQVEYLDGKVWCCFSSSSGYTSVRFRIGTKDEITVWFGGVVEFSGLTIRSIDLMEEAISDYHTLLEKEKSAWLQTKEHEKQEWKTKRAEILKKELAELKNDK